MHHQVSNMPRPCAVIICIVSLLILSPLAFADTPDTPLPGAGTMILEPALNYSTLVGGSLWDDVIEAKMGPDGCVYIIGSTLSGDFPTTPGSFLTEGPSFYVLKFNLTSNSVEYSNQFWSQNDGVTRVWDLEVDAGGHAYVAGFTDNGTFLTTPGAFQETNSGNTDGFILKFAPNGTAVEYGTFVGGERDDYILDIEVDDQGRVHLAGRTDSYNFPLDANAYCQTFYPLSEAGFFAILGQDGSSLEYSTFMSGVEEVKDIEVDDDGEIYVAGLGGLYTPTTPGAYIDVFERNAGIGSSVTRFAPDGRTVRYATLMHGTVRGMQVDASGNVYLLGEGTEDQVTTTEGAFRRTFPGGNAFFVTKLDPSGSSLVYSTLVGGSDWNARSGLILEAGGYITACGRTEDADFPTTPGAFDVSHDTGSTDGVMFRLDPTGSFLSYSTFIGGSEADGCVGLGVAPDGLVTVVGSSDSNDFPTTPDAYKRTMPDPGSNPFIVRLGELVPPEFTGDATPSSAALGGQLTFQVGARDPSSLAEVEVEYWFGNSTARLTRTMNLASGTSSDGTWRVTVSVPADVGLEMSYVVWARDTMGAINRTSPVTIDLLDTRPPDIAMVGSDNATTGDPYNFTVRVQDNVAIGAVHVVYWVGEGDPVNSSMTGLGVDDAGNGDYYLADVVMPSDTTGPLHFHISVRDLAGNWRTSETVDVAILDDDLPVVTEDLSDAFATTGDTFHARVRVHDNIGIASVSSTSPWTALDVDGHGNGVYGLELPVPSDRTGPLLLGINVTDVSGNEVHLDISSREVVDDDAPVIDYEHTFDEFPRGEFLPFHVNVSDNIAIEGLFIIYRFGDGEQINETTDEWVVLEIPRLPGGDMRFRLSAVDGSGNWATTEEYVTRLVNVPPRIRELPVWNVTEGNDSVMPLANYIQDRNGDPLTIGCSDPNVTLDQVSLFLNLRHDSWVSDRTVTVTVSDGEEEVTAQLTIHVVNVNDAPVIVDLLPADGSKFEEGRKVTLSVETEDEEGDEVTVTWYDGDVELGTGPTLAVRLEPGEHTIRVVVDDGTDQVEDSFTVVVKKGEGSPGFGVALVLSAIVGIAVVARWRRD